MAGVYMQDKMSLCLLTIFLRENKARLNMYHLSNYENAYVLLPSTILFL